MPCDCTGAQPLAEALQRDGSRLQGLLTKDHPQGICGTAPRGVAVGGDSALPSHPCAPCSSWTSAASTMSLSQYLSENY